MRISAKETLLLGGGVSRSDNGARWFEYLGVGICVKGTLCWLEFCGFLQAKSEFLRFLASGYLFSAMVRMEVLEYHVI